MTTIKLPYKSDYDFNKLLKQYNSIIHYSYNRFKENILSNKEIEDKCKLLNNIELCDSWIIRCGYLNGKDIHKRNNDNNVIFGGKYNFFQRCLNKITKEVFQENKLLPIEIQGEIHHKGNRKFELDLENNVIIFKLKCKEHINLILPKLTNKYNKILNKIQELSESNLMCYSIKLSKKHICISYDETVLKLHEKFKTNENRILGIDSNPNYIGCSILEFDKNNNFKIIYKFCYDLSKLTVKSEEKSSHKKSKYFHNKLKFEYYQIIKDIIKKCKQYQIKNISVESLSFKNTFKVKELNRLCKGKWLKTQFINNLNKWCNIYDLKLIQINPCYSSIIGNISYENFDPISSSIEIGRRGFECYIQKKKDKFYPKFDEKFIQEWCRRKNIIVEGVIKNWMDFFQFLKKSEIKYRISLDKKLFEVFSLQNIKSNVYFYT